MGPQTDNVVCVDLASLLMTLWSRRMPGHDHEISTKRENELRLLGILADWHLQRCHARCRFESNGNEVDLLGHRLVKAEPESVECIRVGGKSAGFLAERRQGIAEE